MNLKPINTTGAPETLDVGNAVKKVLVEIKKAKADGKVEPAEIIAAITGSLGELIAAADGVINLPAEAKENPMAALRAVVVPVSEGVEALMAP
jgi:hypothetical protein